MMLQQTGIKRNLTPFILLVFTNLFVGSMVGLERTVLPIIGEDEFGLTSTSATLSFIITFGFSKALMNFAAGSLADRFGRKNVLIAGWIVGAFVPLLIITAPAWWVIIFSNVLLGINQGLTWSMTVNMKIDLSSSHQRGLAVGLNEFAGYVGVALFAFITGYLASVYSPRPEPFLIGFVIVLIGLILSFIVPDTSSLVSKNTSDDKKENEPFKNVFLNTSFKNRHLSSVSFAGLTTNLKDGMAWGLFPLFFINTGLSAGQISLIIAIYPATWGIFQLITGPLSDRIGRKILITSGMFIQALALIGITFGSGFGFWLVASITLGLGTAMVYPTLIASISDVASTQTRATSLGIYRFWRDSGYAIGALLAGSIADLLSVQWSIGITALFPLLASFYTLVSLRDVLKT
ncbi:MFS transporter [Pontibacillus sp. HMF3514]|nr:MFS transporter [Pontibacillus sp. HMF3514]